MLKTVVAAAILLSVAGPAFAADTESFTRDGETFVFTKIAGKDKVIVDGRNMSSGEPFHLTIVGGRVTGVSNGRPVSFVMPAGKTDPAQLAAR